MLTKKNGNLNELNQLLKKKKLFTVEIAKKARSHKNSLQQSSSMVIHICGGRKMRTRKQ